MAETYGPTGRKDIGRLADEATDVARDVTDRVSDVATRASGKAEAFRKRAAHQLSEATDYFRKHDAKEIMEDVNGWVKAHPTQALVAAAAVGFVGAALLRRR